MSAIKHESSTSKQKVNNDDLYKELINMQIKNVPSSKKLYPNDLRRICKYIKSSIFDTQKCCLWNGYITNINNSNKGTYINFYYNKKKVALHRLLYINFVGELTKNEYLKFNCENKGMCCNIHHLKKFKYQKKATEPTETPVQVKEVPQKPHKNIVIINRQDSDVSQKKRLFLEFE